MLTRDGIEAFRAYLQELRNGQAEECPRDLLFNAHHSTEFSPSIQIEQRSFRSRIDFCEYIAECFDDTPYRRIAGNEGLWSWLSLFFFDQVCPQRVDGTRRPGMDYRHIPINDFRYRHRHLLEGAYQVYHLYGMDAALLLCSALHSENSFHHELAGRQGFITNPVIISVATELYYDVRHGRPKTGAGKGKNPGALLRFVDVINQLEMTYDLFSMRPNKLLKLLPVEFDRWKT
jgi:hypothetical protein